MTFTHWPSKAEDAEARGDWEEAKRCWYYAAQDCTGNPYGLRTEYGRREDLAEKMRRAATTTKGNSKMNGDKRRAAARPEGTWFMVSCATCGLLVGWSRASLDRPFYCIPHFDEVAHVPDDDAKRRGEERRRAAEERDAQIRRRLTTS